MRLLLIGLAGLGAWMFATSRKSGIRGMTPQRAAVHGHLMGHEMRPEKLHKAAHLFSQEGLSAQANQLQDKARTIGVQMKAAVDLAERSRSGDQNAMAMIAACREQAKKGNMRAFVTCKCIETYCLANPVKDDGPASMAQVS
jgi:hypothetical protein